ncbi:ABC transporter permease subunit [Phytoactinopolyspora limicola]|uniref:ABC transporter permease subunit n=1 Tax=Phytoactinopolyspora limicola TaxID=2715536 RepID=UPI00140DCB68
MPPEPPRGRFGRTKYHLAVARHEPTKLIGVLLAIVFLYLIVAPILSVASDAFRVHFGDHVHTGQEPGAWTGYYLWRVFRSDVSSILFWQPFLNTIVIAVGTTLFALVVGGAMAWLIARTDLPGRKWFSTALVVSYMMPSWTFALAWLTIFKNRRMGGRQGFLEAMGVQVPDWLAYGAFPTIVALGLHYYPFVLLLFGNALRRMDSQLEDSARVLGARRRTIAQRIVLPLMLPSLTSAVLLIFAKILGTFGTPYILGLPVDFQVMSTSLFQSIRNRQNGVAAVIALVVIVVGILVILVDSKILKEYRRFVTVGSKGSMDRRTKLRRWRMPALGLAMTVFTASVIIPIGVLFLSTIQRIPGRFELSNFTLRYWIGTDLDSVAFPRGVLVSGELYSAMWNSFRVVGLAAVCCGVLGLLVGYVVVRTSGTRLSSMLRQISFLPYLVPGIAFAAAYLSLFAVQRGPVPALYGTFTILVIVMVIGNLPYSSRAGISAMMQLGREPEEAAQVSGAGWWRRMTRIVTPIQKGALVTGIILPFISGLKELSTVIMLATSNTELLTTLSVNLVDFGYLQLANAVVLIIAAMAFVATYLAQRLTGSSLASGLQG